jgi:hypothetical protein
MFAINEAVPDVQASIGTACHEHDDEPRIGVLANSPGMSVRRQRVRRLRNVNL